MQLKFKLLFYTLIHLKFTQIVYYVRRRLLPAPRIDSSMHSVTKPEYRRLTLKRTLYTVTTGDRPDEFDFLNDHKSYKGSSIKWRDDNASLLWLYNLHYFDYLQENQRSSSDKLNLIDDWVENNPVGSFPGWEPYPASLRIVNWVKFFAQEGDQCLSATRTISLYKQTCWLNQNIEFHIQANHLFENIKALAYAGLFFSGDMATGWQKKASKYLLKELKEQVLDDGGHYERSPQYHCIMLENYLDLLNVISNNPGTELDKCRPELIVAIIAGLEFLQKITLSDGSIPLFNDSAYGSSPLPNELLDYAERLGIEVKDVTNGSRLVNKPASGIYGYVSKNDSFLIDCGDIGPSYQPGHTHCDFLSYVLMLNSKMIVVDTGVYEYAPGEMRTYVRSTKAHNTVSVDGDEQSEIWGEFRVARRAKKISANIERKPAGRIVFNGGYTGFYAVKGYIRHDREIFIIRGHEHDDIIEFIVKDNITGKGNHQVDSYIHLHPEVEASDLGQGIVNLSNAEGHMATLIIEPGCSYTIDNALYCPEFGKKINNKVVTLSYNGNLPCQISYQIKNIC